MSKRKEKPKDAATLHIRIWTEPGGHLPDDLSEAFEPHAEKVRDDLRAGCHSGEIVDDAFRGWWEIERDANA